MSDGDEREDGELPEGWRVVELGEVVIRLTNGYVGPTRNIYVEDGVPYLLSKHVKRNVLLFDGITFVTPEFNLKNRKSILKAGDVLLVQTGHVGESAVVPPEHEGHNCHAMIVITPKPGVLDGKYLSSYFESPRTRMAFSGIEKGMTLRHLNCHDVIRLQTPVPPLPEQRRIVAKLESLQARSRRAREALEAVPPLLEQLRQSILAAAFRGDLTADWRAAHPDVEPASELLKRIRVERRKKWEEAELAKLKAKGKTPTDDKWKQKYVEPEPVDDSELPELPEGWVWVSLDELSVLVGGITKGQKRRPDAELRLVPYLRVANVQRGHLNLSEVRDIEATEDEIAELKLHAGDILLNEGGDRDKLGRGWVWADELVECIHQNHVFRARPVLVELQPKYISHYANHFGQAFFVDQGKQTTNLASVSMSRVRRFPVALAPLAEQAAIVDCVETHLARTRQIAEQVTDGSARVASVDSAILSKAFRGELVPQDPNDANTPIREAPATKSVPASPPTTRTGKDVRRAKK